MTKEEILEIDLYCSEHGIPKGERLKQLHISHWTYYNSKRIHNQSAPVKAPSPVSSGTFIPIRFSKDGAPSHKTRSSSRRERELSRGNILTIEMRTSNGTEVRIQGQMNTSILREILNSSSSSSGKDV